MKQRIFDSAVMKLAVVMLVAGFVSPVAYAVDTAVAEGGQMVFTVKLGVAPNGWAVRYKYKTKDRSAISGQDYDNTTGTVTFNSGVREKKIYVDTIDDSAEETPEVFRLKLYDQKVNGLYNVTGWVTPTEQIQGMPRKITLTGQIMDNDQTVKAGCGNAGQYCQ